MKEAWDVQERAVTTRQPGNSPESCVCFSGMACLSSHTRLRNWPPRDHEKFFRLRELLVWLRPNFVDNPLGCQRSNFCWCCLGLSLWTDRAVVPVTLGRLIF